jgi:hypothetical protein
MYLGTGRNSETYYCGRRLGWMAIPHSDGQCGPNNGPQCADCLRPYENNHPVAQAVDRGSRTAVLRLLTSGERSNRPVGQVGNWCPLIYRASALGHLDVVCLLLDFEANIDATASDGATALSAASFENRVPTVRLLLDRGAAVNHARLPNEDTCT